MSAPTHPRCAPIILLNCPLYRCVLTLVCPTDDAGTKSESTKILFNKIEVPLDSVMRVLHSWDHELDMYKASLVAYMKARVPKSPLVHGHVPPRAALRHLSGTSSRTRSPSPSTTPASSSPCPR